MQLKDAKLFVFRNNFGGKQAIASKLKKLASDELIVARYPHDQDFTHFKNKSTPMLVANEIPRAFFRDKALGERAVIIPFQARFANPQRDLSFNPAVVRSWIEEGMQSWRMNGLCIPAACRITAFAKRAA
jgi:phage/plasmid-associated DNA primase